MSERKEAVRELRWRLSELFFRFSYRACPDKKAFDYVMARGIDHVRAMNNASRPLLHDKEVEG